MKLINSALVFYFVLPYLVFLFFFNPETNLNFNEVLWALQNTIVQSGISSLLSIGFGFGMALAIYALPKAIQNITAFLLLIPQFLPVIFSLLIGLSLISPYPMGTAGVIFIFTLINSGFAGFLLFQGIGGHFNQSAMIGEIYGINRFKFFIRVLIPGLKEEFKQTFLVIFLFCFTSISVPLVVGGGKGTNLEVLIYEKIFIDQNWSAAWYLNLMQIFLVVLLSLLITKSKINANNVKEYESTYIKSRLMVILLMGYLLTYCFGYFRQVYQSFSEFNFLIQYQDEIINAFLNGISVYMIT